MVAFALIALASPFGVVTSFSTAEAGMENVVFALHYKPKFVASKAIPSLCDDPATPAEEPNYSPNYTNVPCYNYPVTGLPLGAGQVYMVVARAGSEGVSAASFGISYRGSDGIGIDPRYVTWTPCADGLSFPNSDGVHGNFPQPGGGLRITWNAVTSCQREEIGIYGVHAVVGVFYVYAYSNDLLRTTPNYNQAGGPELAIASCAGVTTDLVDVWGLQNVLWYSTSGLGFGTERGCNPCWVSEYPPCDVVPVSPSTWGRMKAKYGERP